MKAIVYTKYGSPEVLQLEEVEEPAPRDDEVLVRIHAAAVNPLDWHYLRAAPFFMRFFAGLLRPKNNILGADISGKVEAVGTNVKQFQAVVSVIDRVYPLSEVPEAIRYLEEGHARGKVVITLEHNNRT
jgi:NADPH:quinone reductase-like Zn-dependent oxidoreductase